MVCALFDVTDSQKNIGIPRGLVKKIHRPGNVHCEGVFRDGNILFGGYHDRQPYKKLIIYTIKINKINKYNCERINPTGRADVVWAHEGVEWGESPRRVGPRAEGGHQLRPPLHEEHAHLGRQGDGEGA